MTEETKPLTKKQEIFVNEYLQCFNGAEAARRAGYSEARARQTAAELLANSDISLQIQARLNEVHMSADEALKLTADIARGDVTEFITGFGNIDIDAVRKSGKGRLIKKIKQKTVTKIGKGDTDADVEVLDTEIELYPADAALDKILKIHGKYSDAPTVNINMSWKEFVESANRSASNNNT
jgi:phage terminase small subunit